MLESVNEAVRASEGKFADPTQDQERAAADIDEALTCMERLSETNLPQTLLNSLFLGLFSAYDAFSGDLLHALYLARPEFLENLKVEASLSELLKYDSFSELKEAVLYEEIESFRRKSYIEQFESLEKRFKLSLKKFEHWPEFVEIGQRRNLVTHCDGKISKQYINVCSENGVIFDGSVKEGTVAEISPEYLLSATKVLYEVCFKLGQTLWRKVVPSEIIIANSHLAMIVYDALKVEKWERACILSEFAVTHKDSMRDLDRRMGVVNYAIALKFCGKIEDSKKHLESEDWSATLPEFTLALAVLSDDTDAAVEAMHSIGKQGQILRQSCYHVWPLFREFRRSDKFIKAYEEIFGCSFASEALEVAKSSSGNVPVDEASSKEEQRVAFKPSMSSIRFLLN